MLTFKGVGGIMMDFKVNEQLDVTQDTNEQALLHIKEKV